ncbi:MAG: asparagine synthase (glutamine-hydrolyzing) [bacterium]|nr:asparagine synthase (glutamine-hydrolyzing) [bacterium]
MCGILGAYSKLDRASWQPKMSLAMQHIAHRGPDDSGIDCIPTLGGELILGHRRLSILDLSRAGHQPMYSSDNRFALIFNGEIYNYKELRAKLQKKGIRFFTDTDSEVLLNSWICWGKDALSKFEGMFAFSIYDKEEKTLFLARDAFGIKPLYYSLIGSELRFASELPALRHSMEFKPGINEQIAYEYLNFSSYDGKKETFFKNLYRLLPGYYAEIDLNDIANLNSQEDNASFIQQIRWWSPSIEENKQISFENASDELRERFLHNIEIHLRSDVPLGAALSGGVDSSAVTCGIRHLYPDMPIHTFTFAAKGSEVDETKWSAHINKKINASSNKIIIKPSELAKDVDDLILTQGEPFGTTSIYAQYRVFKYAKERGITVMLEGQGADEMLAGYNGYPNARLHSLIQKGELRKFLTFVERWANWPGRSREQSIMMAKSAFGKVLPNQISYLFGKKRDVTIQSWLNKDQLLDNGIDLNPSSLTKADGKFEHAIPKGRMLSNAMRDALSEGGIQRLLRHGDRNSMRWSIESRVPFLTHSLAEFCLSLPEQYHLSDHGETKHLFRHAMRGIIPDEVIDRKDKIGFATPEFEWLKQLDTTAMIDIDVVAQQNLLDFNLIDKFIKGQVNGNLPYSSSTWRIINYLRWVKLFN